MVSKNGKGNGHKKSKNGNGNGHDSDHDLKNTIPEINLPQDEINDEPRMEVESNGNDRQQMMPPPIGSVKLPMDTGFEEVLAAYNMNGRFNVAKELLTTPARAEEWLGRSILSPREFVLVRLSMMINERKQFGRYDSRIEPYTYMAMRPSVNGIAREQAVKVGTADSMMQGRGRGFGGRVNRMFNGDQGNMEG